MAKNVSTTIVLKVNGKDVENSFRGLSKEVRSLENELKELTPGTERFMRKAAELKEVKEHFSRVKSEIDAVSGRLEESEGFLGKLRSKLSDVGLGFGAIGAGLAGLHLKNTAEEYGYGAGRSETARGSFRCYGHQNLQDGQSEDCRSGRSAWCS